MSRLTRMRAPLLTAAGGLLACGYVYLNDPSEPGFYPPCPMKVLTGLDCPLCGSLRATHALLHADLPAALDFNAMTVLVVLPVTLALLVAWTVQRWRGKPLRVTVPRWATAAIVTLAVVFTVVRNIPGMPWGSAV